MCQDCMERPTIKEEIREALVTAIDYYNENHRSTIEQIVGEMQETINSAIKDGVTDVDEILRRNIDIINRVAPGGVTLSPHEASVFVERARAERRRDGLEHVPTEAYMKILGMKGNTRTIDEDKDGFGLLTRDEKLWRSIMHYMAYHYTAWEIFHPLISKDVLDAFLVFAENHAGNLARHFEEEGLILILDKEKYQHSLLAALANVTVEGAVMGYYAGANAQDCVLGELHDHPHGVFTSPDSESSEEYSARLDEVRNLAHDISSEKESNSSENEANE